MELVVAHEDGHVPGRVPRHREVADGLDVVVGREVAALELLRREGVGRLAFEARVLAAKRVTLKGMDLERDEVGEIVKTLEIGLEIGVKKTEEKRKSANKNHNKML